MDAIEAAIKQLEDTLVQHNKDLTQAEQDKHAAEQRYQTTMHFRNITHDALQKLRLIHASRQPTEDGE